MNKKVLLSIILVLSLVMLFAGCAKTGPSSLVNGDFTTVTSDPNKAVIEGWSHYVDPELKDAARNVFGHIAENNSVEDKDHGKYLMIKTSKLGVNYLYQTVTLDKNKTYKLSVDIKTLVELKDENSNKMLGAWVGFVEDGTSLIRVRNRNNGWKNYEMYFQVNTSKPMTLGVGIGHPGSTKSSGTAYFDNIKIEEVDPATVPAGALKMVNKPDDGATLANPESIAFVVVGAIVAVIMIALFMYTYRKNMSKDMLSDNKMLSNMALFIYVMLGAFIIRFLLAIFTKGMVSELNALGVVANKFSGKTKLSMIMPLSGTTLPAGMLYLLYIVNGLANLMAIKGDGFNILLRLPFILADLVAIYMIFSMVSKRQKEHTAIFVAGLYGILPSVIMASTGWGMEISLVGCLLIGMFYCMLNKNYIGVSALFVASLLFSNLTVLLLPLVLAYLINAFVKYSDARLKIGLSSLIGLIAFYCISIPFYTQTGKGNPIYMFKVMFQDLTATKVLTSNAFNLYGMIGMNLAPLTKVMDILNTLFVIVLMTVTVFMYLKNRDRLNIILMSAFTMIAVSTLCVRGSLETLALGIVLLFVYAMIANSRRAYALVGGFSILSFLNMTLLMSNSGFIGGDNLNANVLVSFARLDPAFVAFSLIAVLMTFYLGYVVYDVCVRDRIFDIAPLEGKLKDDIKTRFELFKKNMLEKKNASKNTSEEQ